MDVEQLLRTNFADRADDVVGTRPDLPDAVRAGYRAQRRHRAGTAAGVVAGALAVGLVVGGGLLLRSQPDGGDAAGPPHATTIEGPVDLYDIPARGSLAGDEEFLDRVAGLSWDDGIPRDPGESFVPPESTRRVLFAGEVPGGQVWALVEGVVRDRTVFAWFTGTTPDDMALTWGPDYAFPDTPVALHDATGDAGPVVVVTKPGDVVRYAELGDSGEPLGGYRDLPTVDGVAIGTAPSPIGPWYVQVEVFRDGTQVYAFPPQQFDTARPGEALNGPAAAYALSMLACLARSGYDVAVQPDGGFVYDPAPADAAVQEAQAAAEQQCRVELGFER